MNYRIGFFILAIVLGGLVSYMIFKPKPIDNPYFLREMKKSIERQDSLVTLVNKLKPLRNEQKEFRAVVDSIYVDISKDSLRARIGHNMLTHTNR